MVEAWLNTMPQGIREQAAVFPLTAPLRWRDQPHYTMGYFVDQDGLNVMITPYELTNLTCDGLRMAVEASFPVVWKRLMREQRLH